MAGFLAQVREKWKWSRRGIPPPPSWYCKGDDAWILECKIPPEEEIPEVQPSPVCPDSVTVGIWSEWGMRDEKFSFSLLRLEELGFQNLVTRINKASKKKPFLVDNEKEKVRLHRFGNSRLTINVLKILEQYVATEILPETNSREWGISQTTYAALYLLALTYGCEPLANLVMDRMIAHWERHYTDDQFVCDHAGDYNHQTIIEVCRYTDNQVPHLLQSFLLRCLAYDYRGIVR